MIIEMLRDYRKNVSDLKLLENEEARLRQEYLYIVNEEVSYISAVHISDMPKSVTNKFSSVVENTAIQREIAQQRTIPILDRMNEISKEKFDLQCEIDRVNALLERLSMEERFVIRMHYIEDLCWSLVVEQYRKEFGQYRSIPALKRKRNSAINLLNQAA